MASISRKSVWRSAVVLLGTVLWCSLPAMAGEEYGGIPKPDSHQVNWLSRHQAAAKENLTECQACHTNQMFCADCHQRRDTVQERVHKRNFRVFHSIQARANPRRCDACHTVSYCQECHAGRGTSKR